MITARQNRFLMPGLYRRSRQIEHAVARWNQTGGTLHTLEPSEIRPIVRQVVIQWPNSDLLRKWFWRSLLFLVAVYLIYAVRDIWIPLLLAFLIATVLDPVV